MNRLLIFICVSWGMWPSGSTGQVFPAFVDPIMVEDYLFSDTIPDREYMISRIKHDIEYFDIQENELYNTEQIGGVGLYEVVSSGGEFNGMYLHVLRVLPFDTLNHERSGEYTFYQCGGREWTAPIQIYDYFPVKLERGTKIGF